MGGTGGDYDGVVPINRSDFGAAVASGAILSTPMYILTAAHVVGKDKAGALDLPATAVEFSSQRTGGALGTIRVEVPGGADFLSVPQAPFAFPWDHRTGKQVDDADIGIIALPDQNVATRTADRVMIAPYRATPWGGNRYDVFAGAVVGKQFSMVGFGMTGIGPDGQHNDRVDRVTIPNPLVGAGNDFTITIGAGAAATTTAKLSQKTATAAQVAAALNAADPPGPGRPTHYLVHKVSDGVWDIRFANDRSQGNDLGGVTAITRFDGAAAAGMAAPIANRWAGASTGGTKRTGENEFDRTKAGNARILEYDFDNTAKGINPFGTAGLGGLETSIAPGDSGGPGIIRVGGVPQIAGVVSYSSTFPIGAANPDVTPYVDGGGAPSPDSSIGEFGGYTHVQPYMAGYVTPFITRQVDLILDMNFQTYGKTVAGEKIEIFVRKIGANLEIEVKGGDAALDGIYAKIDASTVKSLTIRGTDDNEIVKIEGPLGFAAGSKAIIFEGGGGDDQLIISGLQGAVAAGDIGIVQFDGGAGNNTIIVDDSAGVGDGNTYTFESPDAVAAAAGWTQRLSRTTPVGVGRPNIDTKLVQQFTLKTGTGNDVIQVRSVDATVTGSVFIQAGAGDDQTTIGDAANGIANVKAAVAIDGQAGDDLLIVEDSASAVARTYEIGAPNPAAAGWAGQVRRTDLAANVRTLFGNVERVELRAGSKDDLINVTAVDASVTGGLTLKGNDGDDKFTIGSAANGLGDIAGVVNVDGGANNNTLIVDDAGGKGGKAAYKINKGAAAGAGNVRKQAAPNVPFIEFQNIRTPPVPNGTSIAFLGRAAGTEIEVAGLWPDTGFEFVGNTGADLLVLTADTTGGGGTPARVSFVGGSGTDEVKVVAGNYQTGSLSAVGSDRFALAFAPLEVLTISGGLLDVRTTESVEKYTQSGGTLDGDATLTATDSLAWTGGTMTGGGVTVAAWGALLTVDGPVILDDRTLRNQGFGTWQGDILGGTGTFHNQGTLDGNGWLAGTLTNDGTLNLANPGAVGGITVSGPFTQSGSGTVHFDLVTPGGSDLLTVSGPVTLDGALSLSALSGFSGESFTLIDNTGPSAVGGTFTGLPEGTVVSINGVDYTISYQGGDGNDVVLSMAGSGGSGGGIGDYVWDDANGNGIQDSGEYGVGGVTVNLLDEHGNWLSSTMTDSSGYYYFGGLGAGTYEVEFVAPSGYAFTLQNYGSDHTLDSDADPTTGRTGTFALAADEQRTDLDAGLVYSGSGGSGGSIGDYVWDDSNGNGIQDGGEWGVSGVTVNLLDEYGNWLTSTTTDSYGYYYFGGLSAGNYRLEFVAPSGYAFTLQNQGGNSALDSDADVFGMTAIFSLGTDQYRTDIDAGLVYSGSGGSGGSIGDYVWYDADQDGVQDPGEWGFGGMTVHLRDGSGNLLSSTTSDWNGYYWFGGLGAGTYQVEFVPPAGHALTTSGWWT